AAPPGWRRPRARAARSAPAPPGCSAPRYRVAARAGTGSAVPRVAPAPGCCARPPDAERNECVLGIAEGAAGDVVGARRRMPGLEHADRGEVLAVHADAAAGAVLAAEQAIVDLGRKHHHPGPGLVLALAPAAAVAERRLEH